MEYTFDRISEFKQKLSELIRATPDSTFPHVLIFEEGIAFPTYRVTVEVIEKNYFIDAKGVKWIRAED